MRHGRRRCGAQTSCSSSAPGTQNCNVRLTRLSNRVCSTFSDALAVLQGTSVVILLAPGAYRPQIKFSNPEKLVGILSPGNLQYLLRKRFPVPRPCAALQAQLAAALWGAAAVGGRCEVHPGGHRGLGAGRPKGAVNNNQPTLNHHQMFRISM